MRINRKDIDFRIEYYRWFWKKSKKKQKILEMYCMGYNQLEIAGLLLISPLKIRKDLIALRKSMEYNIKVNKLLEN